MKDDSQATTSIWMGTANTPSQSRLKDSIRTDICVIGAGIAGLTTAYLLGREGRSVVVLDDGMIGGGMTGRTTAHLSNGRPVPRASVRAGKSIRDQPIVI